MIDSVRCIYERKKPEDLNGPFADPYYDGLYNLSEAQIIAIRKAGTVCTDQEVSVTISIDE